MRSNLSNSSVNTVLITGTILNSILFIIVKKIEANGKKLNLFARQACRVLANSVQRVLVVCHLATP